MSWTKRVTRTIGCLVASYSFYVAPLAILLLSALLLFTQSSLYAARGHLDLPIRIQAEQADRPLAPAQALERLEQVSPVPIEHTRLSEAPFWFSVSLPAPAASAADRIIEFPSRHTTSLECWNAETLQWLGQADQEAVTGHLHAVKAGHALPVASLDGAASVLCRTTQLGPANISAALWAADELEKSTLAFHRSAGLLEGGLLTLAVFYLMAAAINREGRYVVFAAWLIGNLRLGALSMGWDIQWLERLISPEWLPTVRQLSMATYYLLTYTLFSQFFRSELGRIGYGWLLRVVLYNGVLLFALALILPYSTFLPVMWGLVAIGVAGVVFFLTRLLIIVRSRIALWYSLALTLVLMATFGEIITAVFRTQSVSGVLNSVTAALAASLMTAVAFAEQMRAERKQRVQAQAELHSAYQVTPVGLFTLALDGTFVRANPALHRKLGISPAALRDTRWQDHFGADSWDSLLTASSQQPDGGQAELRRPDATGEIRGYLLRAMRSGDCIEGSLQDITERLKATETLRFLANHDSLTTSLNRRGVEQALSVALAREDQDSPLSLAYLDLDRFKLLNDLYGHHIGDDVLRQVHTRISQVLNPGHQLGRLGGDEFLIVMADTPLVLASDVGRRIVQAIRGTPFRVNSRAFQVHVSIGIIEATPGMTFSEAISAADRACRDAKKKPTQHIVVYERHAPEFREHAEQLRLIEELGSSFNARGLFLEMQPIMSLRDPEGALDFEVLLRMRDANQTLVPAGKILAAAEASGHMADLDKWVLTTTLNWLREHRHELANTRFVCVNLSGSSLNDEAFIEDLSALLCDYEDLLHLLCIEITESVALHDLQNTCRVVDSLRERGIKIALDDFGAGYTSFSYLKELSADAVKIDGSFVRSMTRHPADIAIVEAIVELTHNLGMRSIAEWVEDHKTLQALADMGVDYVQGYVIARPQSSEALLQASSAASFITDPDLAELVRDIGRRQRNMDNDDPSAPLYYH